VARIRNPYPALTNILQEMFADNYGTLYDQYIKPLNQWGWPMDAVALEEKAAAMTPTERAVFASGEDTEQRSIVRKYQCQRLHDFINDVFDGDLTSNFVKETR
jgi:hypothetical protein